jgi:hypothetical protein
MPIPLPGKAVTGKSHFWEAPSDRGAISAHSDPCPSRNPDPGHERSFRLWVDSDPTAGRRRFEALLQGIWLGNFCGLRVATPTFH